MRKLFIGPISPILVFEKLLLLCVWLLLQIYILKYFILQKIGNGITIYLVIFILSWVWISLTWVHSYVYVSWLDPGSVDAEFQRYCAEMGNNFAPSVGHIPRCDKCGSMKPIRAHHCSRCGKCYVRFDHHCPIVGSCIAYGNAQPFVVYVTSGAAVFLITSAASFAAPLFGCVMERTLTKCIGGVCFVLGMIVAGFAFRTISGLYSDETTLEKIYRQKMGHRRGQREDLDAIWGYNWYEWFYAHRPRINGMVWSGCVCR